MSFIGTGTLRRIIRNFLFPGPAATLILILLFAATAAFVGTRLGICWVILEERWPEFREQVRDPYPAIAEKAVGPWGRYSTVHSNTVLSSILKRVVLIRTSLWLYPDSGKSDRQEFV
jgi:hypothetical protein